MLASLALFGLGIFGPGIAAGLVAGGPQLGAGSAIGTGAALAGGALRGRRRCPVPRRINRLGAVRAGTAMGSGAGTAYRLGKATSGASGMAGVGAGLSGVARAASGAARQGMGFGGGSVGAWTGRRPGRMAGNRRHHGHGPWKRSLRRRRQRTGLGPSAPSRAAAPRSCADGDAGHQGRRPARTRNQPQHS